jgi:hypothetical protein
VTIGLSAPASATVTSAPRLKREIRFWMSVGDLIGGLAARRHVAHELDRDHAVGRTTTFSTTGGSGRIVTTSLVGRPDQVVDVADVGRRAGLCEHARAPSAAKSRAIPADRFESCIGRRPPMDPRRERAGAPLGTADR